MVISTDGIPSDEVVDSIEQTLAEQLNIHPSNIDVEYDSESGVVSYTIASDNADTLSEVLINMQEEGFEDTISDVDGIVVSAYESPIDIVATVAVIIDASKSAMAFPSNKG